MGECIFQNHFCDSNCSIKWGISALPPGLAVKTSTPLSVTTIVCSNCKRHQMKIEKGRLGCYKNVTRIKHSFLIHYKKTLILLKSKYYLLELKVFHL